MISERIEVNPSVLVGKPVIKGTRVGVEQVIEHLAAGWTHHDVLENYPRLSEQDIYACLAYAASLVHDERVFPLKAV